MAIELLGWQHLVVSNTISLIFGVEPAAEEHRGERSLEKQSTVGRMLAELISQPDFAYTDCKVSCMVSRL